MEDIYFPPRELAVMSVLWRLGSASVSEVRDALEDSLAYTSVLSALQTLEEKNYVRHEPEGRATAPTRGHGHRHLFLTSSGRERAIRAPSADSRS